MRLHSCKPTNPDRMLRLYPLLNVPRLENICLNYANMSDSTNYSSEFCRFVQSFFGNAFISPDLPIEVTSYGKKIRLCIDEPLEEALSKLDLTPTVPIVSGVYYDRT